MYLLCVLFLCCWYFFVEFHVEDATVKNLKSEIVFCPYVLTACDGLLLNFALITFVNMKIKFYTV